MRRLSFALLTLALFVSASGADDASDARALVNKAIKAFGGEEKIAQFKSQTFRETGTYYGLGKGLPYTGVYALQCPDHFRMEIEGVFTMVVAGSKGWMKSEKGTMEMTKEQLENELRNLYGGEVAMLITLKDKAFTLTALPEIKIDEKPAAGVKVTRKDKPDVTLYFDKATGLLAKSEMVVKPNEPQAKEAKQETFLSEYKEFAGCKVATKVVVKRDGKLFVEAEMKDIKPVKKHDEKTFSKP